MEVKKVGCFSTNEVEALRGAGTILGSTVKALEEGEIDTLDAHDVELVSALVDVLSRLSFHIGDKK